MRSNHAFRFAPKNDTRKITHSSGPLNLDLFVDGDGRIQTKVETLEGRANRWEYRYAQGRLAEVVLNGGVVEQYQYDRLGRRVLEVNRLRGIGNREYAYDGQGFLSHCGDVAYVHDAQGFLVSAQRGDTCVVLRYDDQGRLDVVVLPEGRRIVYGHDRRGRRTSKELNGARIATWRWGDAFRLRETNDGSMMRFDYEGESRLPRAMVKDGRIYALAFDQVGTLKAVADDRGHLVRVIDRDSFGNVVADSNPNFSLPFGFAGGLEDEHTGLVRFGFRDYDPDTGRFTARDPLGYAAGDPDLYGYCLDDPINSNDPLGLMGTIGKLLLKQIGKLGVKKGVDEAQKRNPDNRILYWIDRGLNGSELAKDPMATDSDGDGVPDYYDPDSDYYKKHHEEESPSNGTKKDR